MYSITTGARRLPTATALKTPSLRQRHPQSLNASTEDAPDASETKPKKFDQSKINTYRIPEGKTLPVLLLSSGFLLRAGSGCFVDGYSLKFDKIASYPRPVMPIELYEYESCPFCRKVREALSILDLDAMIYPTPRGAPHHRPKAEALGGKQKFPFMVDPNTDTSMYESDDIVAYLFEKYGDGQIPLSFRLGPLTAISLALFTLLRIGRGFNYRNAVYPEQPLVLWSYEISPFSKFVREALTELELPYLHVACARGSNKRQKLFDTVGAFQAPYLEDPNTGVAMFESDKILEYLETTYAQ